MAIRVLIADNHAIIREGLRALLEGYKQMNFEVAGEAGNGREAVELCRTLHPNIVIMDVTMPGINGIEATKQILKMDPAIKILGLSMHKDKQYVTQMLEAGACGYILKARAFGELIQGIRAALANKTYLGPEIASMVVEGILHDTSRNAGTASTILTDRQREVLQLVAEGKTTKEIAYVLHCSPKTIEAHRRQIMGRLGLHSVAELTQYAIREGMITLDQ